MPQPVLIEFTAQYVASAPTAASQPASKKGAKPDKARAASGGHANGNGRPAAGLSVLAATSRPMEVVPASQKAEVKRRATSEGAAAQAAAAHPASLHSSASSRVIEFCGHQLVIEEWPSNTAACTGAFRFSHSFVFIRRMRMHRLRGCGAHNHGRATGRDSSIDAAGAIANPTLTLTRTLTLTLTLTLTQAPSCGTTRCCFVATCKRRSGARAARPHVGFRIVQHAPSGELNRS